MRNDTLSIILVVLSIVLLICCTIVQNITQNTINKQKDTIDTQKGTIAIMQDTIDTQKGTIATMQEIIDIEYEKKQHHYWHTAFCIAVSLLSATWAGIIFWVLVP